MAPPLASRYELGRELARGETSVVHEATDRTLGRAVAIKILRAAAFDAAARGRFAREARALAEVRSAHAVEILDVVDHDGAPAIVMERLDGVTLSETLRREGPFAPTRALRIAREILDALAAAHRAGIVHRRVEPSNVLLVRSPAGEIAKVIDFGLAGEAATDALTTATPFRRRPTHVAPEVLAGAPATTSSDVYSVGSILFEIVAGAPLHSGDAAAVLAQKLSGAPGPKAASVAPGLPRDLASLVDALVAPVGARPRDAAAALEIFAASADEPRDVDVPPLPRAPRARPRVGALVGVTVGAVTVAALTGAVGAVVTAGRGDARAIPDVDAPDAWVVRSAPVSPSVAPSSTASSGPAPSSTGSAPRTAESTTARCLCKTSHGLTLCPTPRTPRCACEDEHGPLLCRVPYVVANDGGLPWGSGVPVAECPPASLDYSSSSAKSGDSCKGYNESWWGTQLSSRLVLGTLACDRCYPHLAPVPRSIGVHGAHCTGYTNEDDQRDGAFDCR